MDDFPRRLSATPPSARAEPLYVGLLGAAASHERLRSSAWAAAVLPGALAAQGPQAFREREMLDALGYPELRPPGSSAWSDLAEVMPQPAAHLDAGSVHDLVLDADATQVPVQPKAVSARLVTAHHPGRA